MTLKKFQTFPLKVIYINLDRIESIAKILDNPPQFEPIILPKPNDFNKYKIFNVFNREQILADRRAEEMRIKLKTEEELRKKQEEEIKARQREEEIKKREEEVKKREEEAKKREEELKQKEEELKQKELLLKQKEDKEKEDKLREVKEIKEPIIDSKKQPEEIKAQVSFKFKDQFLKASNNYYTNLRLRVKETAERKDYKSQVEKILLDVNTQISQLQQESGIQIVINCLKKIFAELKDAKKDDLYMLTLDFVYKRLLLKSAGYLREEKSTFVTFAKLIWNLSLHSKIAADSFFQIITYRCPYIIPKSYNKNDYPNPDELRRRQGFSDKPDAPESLESLLNNMECYALIYFNFLILDMKYFPIIEEFLLALEVTKIEYPMICIVKTFIYVCGKLLKEKGQFGKLEAIGKKYQEEIEKMKVKAGNMKSYLLAGSRLIKKYLFNIKNNKKTDE
jgi:hypothetical protein